MTILSTSFVKIVPPEERYVEDSTFAESEKPEISQLSRHLDLGGLAPGLLVLMSTPETLRRGIRKQERINRNKRGINAGLCS